MSHLDLVEQTLKNFDSEQLNQIYIDLTLNQIDQEELTLKTHITECSENWLLSSFGMTSDCRSPNSIEDMMGYIKTNLELV